MAQGDTTGLAIFGPFLGMLLLSLAVWVVMYVRRLRFIAANRIDAQELTSAEKAASLFPEAIHWPAHNFRNLFELPVAFYALCLYLYVSGSVDTVYVAAAWAFLVTRIAHSLIHCTVNIVRLRFASYMLGAIVLWFMVLRAALDWLN